MHGMTTYNLNDFDRAEAMFDESSDLARQGRCRVDIRCLVRVRAGSYRSGPR